MNAYDDLKWFLGILLVLFIAWYALGSSSPDATDGPFIRPLSPVGSGEVYGPHSPTVSPGENWNTIETTFFTARIPSQWIHRKITTDGEKRTGELRNPEHVIKYEQGPGVRIPILDLRSNTHNTEKIRIDGTVGTLFTPTTPPGMHGIYVQPRIAPPFLLYGDDLPAAYETYLKQIGASIEFRSGS